MKLVILYFLATNFQFLFSTEGFGELRKYGGDLKRRSALGVVSIESEIFQWGKIKGVIFGFEKIWMGRDVGLIQLDPQEADYLLGAGVKRELNERWIGLYLDHTCYHKIDTLVDRALYWNKLKLVYSNKDFNFKYRFGQLYYRGEFGFYLRSEKIPWLTVGNPNVVDFYADLFYMFKFFNKVKPFIEATFYSGLTLQYNLTPEVEVNLGVVIPGLNNDCMLYVGIRPIDRKGYREAEGAPYLGLKVKF